MTVVTNVTMSWNGTTKVLTLTVVKQEIRSLPTGPAIASDPVTTVTTVDLSALVL